MDIVPFIHNLLLDHDCVVVPGFGGFIANYFPARIDNGSSTLHPPRKVLSFNKNLMHNDGLLMGTISKSLGIDYPEARMLVDDFVVSVKRRLEAGENVNFKNVGSFADNSEGGIQFEPDTRVNFNLGSYGLEPIDVEPQKKYDVREKVIKHIDREPIRPYSTRRILWRAAVIVPLIALLVAVPLKTDLFNGKTELSTLNPLASTELESNKEAISSANISFGEAETNTSSAPALETSVSAPIAPVSVETVVSSAPITGVSASKGYSVVTGSFKVKENALAQAEMLREKGYTPEIMEASNGFFRVSAAVYGDLQTAAAQRAVINETFPGSWVTATK